MDKKGVLRLGKVLVSALMSQKGRVNMVAKRSFHHSTTAIATTALSFGIEDTIQFELVRVLEVDGLSTSPTSAAHRVLHLFPIFSARRPLF